jgi:hypothetical protein
MSRTVKFRPPGGSYLDLRKHEQSDSGIGSMSDVDRDDGRGANATFTKNYDHSDLYALHVAETTKREEWMNKAHRLDEMLIRPHKELKEHQARIRALEDRVDELDEEKQKLVKANNALADKNARLEEDLKYFKRESRRPPRWESQGSSVVSGSGSEEKRPRRSKEKGYAASDTGVRARERLAIERERDRITKEIQKEREREEERQKEREMERLRWPFADLDEAKEDRKSPSSAKSIVCGATLVADLVYDQSMQYLGSVSSLPIRTHQEKQLEPKPPRRTSKGEARKGKQATDRV